MGNRMRASRFSSLYLQKEVLKPDKGPTKNMVVARNRGFPKLGVPSWGSLEKGLELLGAFMGSSRSGKT